MLIARVIGDIVATQKDPSHKGRKILVVQPLQLDGSNRGEPILALDSVDAGVGDRVLLATEGFSGDDFSRKTPFADRYGSHRRYRRNRLRRESRQRLRSAAKSSFQCYCTINVRGNCCVVSPEVAVTVTV